MTDRPITIVAECGINHNGDIGRAGEMVWAAKMCGADVAKFQIYVPERLLDRSHPVIREHWDTIKATELTLGNVCYLKGLCDAIGIEFLASVFHPDRVEWTEKIGMEQYKIASRSIYDEDLARAIAATGKPVIMSYGHYKHPRRPPIEDLLHPGLLSRLYCVSQYPTLFDELHLGASTFFDRYYAGFSDHTVGITASVVAMSVRAEIIEKHFTLDRGLPGPDQVCSIEPDELRRLCNMRDDIEKILWRG